MTEIGRLREVTFRAAGEGTGRCLDLDRFDDHDHHLFVWHRDKRQIAGAYRIGASDLVAGRRVAGLYTRTLFRFGRRLLDELGPALELGRSFVTADYQRDFGTLALLWKGIGRFVVRHPRYRVLFGPVSISADYTPASRELLVGTLLQTRLDRTLSPLVRPKRPLAVSSARGDTPSFAVDELQAVVAELEPDGKAMPVLLRHYLKLGGRLLAFSVDPAFGHVVDGLIVVDLLDVDRATLQRYMGLEGLASFLAWHAAQGRDAQRHAGSIGARHGVKASARTGEGLIAEPAVGA